MLDGASHHKVTHHIPEGALVEIIAGPNAGVRLWVIEQCPTDSDASPLYHLGVGKPIVIQAENNLRIIHDPDPIIDEAINDNQTEAC